MTRNEICGVYKIENTLTGDFYIGSSKDVKRRWWEHKKPSVWNRYSKYPLYSDMQKYGVDKFDFQILTEVEIEQLKETEQQFIEMLKPTYNNYNANGQNVDRYKESQKEYHKYYDKEHYQQNREAIREAVKEYQNQLCSYNGETLTLRALRKRFQKAGIEHPTLEAKKYILEENED